MKKGILVGILALAVICLGLASAPAMAKTYKIKIGGGPTGGTFNAFASGMAAYVPKKDANIQCTAVGSGGSVANVRRVNNKESDFGLSYGGDLWLGANGKLPKDTKKYDDVRIMGFLYGAPAQLVVRAGLRHKKRQGSGGQARGGGQRRLRRGRQLRALFPPPWNVGQDETPVPGLL